MANNASAPILIMGVGNIDRGDDGVGIFALKWFRPLNVHGVQLLQHSGEGTSLIDLWQANNASIVYIVDATCSGLPPGSIQYFEAHDKPLPAHFGWHTSTHAFGLAEAVELARSLECLPQKLIIYGIEGQCFDFGAPLSSEVERASLRVMELILNEHAILTETDMTILP